EGIYFGAQYWHEVDTPFNNELVAAVRDAYDITPTYPLAADYTMTRVMLEVADQSGASTGPALIEALEGYTYQGPTGEETIRASDHQVIKDYYLLQGKAQDEMDDDDDYADVISAGQSFVAPEDSPCQL
ncbi:MAG: ABC transporter substrate-binding protein, partial [Pseudomonadota bacterium]|nr:ABC transporter substrate-binding protein [Pseudomonadota bacterium]